MAKSTQYGLYGEDNKFLLPDFMHCETIAFRSRKHDWVIEPHQHAHLFQVFLIESGEVQFFFEGKTLIFNEPCVISIPENTPHGFEFSADIEGKVLTLSQSFIETLFESSPNVILELNTTRILRGVSEHRRFQIIGRIVHRLYDELREEFPEKKLALQSYFSLLLTEIFRLSLEKSERTSTPDNRNAKYYQAFQQSIKQSFSPQKTIQDYARELKITPVHLNRVCQVVAQKSALQVAQEYLIIEAEKYLKHTDYSVSEIAYRLNFTDPAYFSRLFKKQMGVSPKVFRENALKS
jgi:AraC family transcriptional regulator, transcriptional activator of pobA